MKTIALIYLLTFTFYAKAQQFQFGQQNSGVSVENKEEKNNSPEALKNIALLKTSFEKTIDTYKEALNSEKKTLLQETIGRFQTQTAQEALSRINITVVVLEKTDPQDHPITCWVPTFVEKEHAYVTKIPYKFVELVHDDLRIEHLAAHEVAQIVAGNLDNNPAVGAEDSKKEQARIFEEQRQVEYVVYATFGEEKYMDFMKSGELSVNPDTSPETMKNFLNMWMKFLGVSKTLR